MGGWGSEGGCGPVSGCRGFVPPPSVAVGCVWFVFVGCFLFWGCLGVCFVCGLVLNSYCSATGLLECGLSGVGVSFYVLVSLLGGFSCVFGWCSLLFGGLDPPTRV